MPATIYDIASKAGVSSSTVARVLRGDMKGGRKDSAERAARIRKIADELGYRPNLRARAFSQQRTKGVGLLYTDDAWVFQGVNDQVLQGLVRELRKCDHHLLLIPVDEGRDWEEAALGGHVDGCVTFQLLPEEVRASLRESNLPYVLLGDRSDPDCPHVVVDDPAGAYAAARHLIALGHRRIGLYVHDSVKPHCSIQERREGYEAALRDEGLEPLFRHCGENEMIAALVRGADRPTGLICYSDLESTLITHAMWQFGVKIPGDLSLIGFNDKFATKYMTPPLTTVAFDAHRVGSLGAQMILRRIDGADENGVNKSGADQNGAELDGAGETSGRAAKVATQLVIRGSTAAPPASDHAIGRSAAQGEQPMANS